MEKQEMVSFSYIEIEQIANDFLEFINPEMKFPISDDMWKKAEQFYNAKIVYTDEPTIKLRAMYDKEIKNETLKKFGKKIIIQINKDMPPQFQRNALAYGFAFFLIDSQAHSCNGLEMTFLDDINRDKNLGFFYNTCAGCILMPMNKVEEKVDAKQLLTPGKLSYSKIEYLSKNFGVPVSDVKNRVEKFRKYYDLVTTKSVDSEYSI